MIEIKTEELVKPLSDDSNLTPVYNRLKDAVQKAHSFIWDEEFDETNKDTLNKFIKEFIAQYSKDYKIIKLAKIDPELIKQYEGCLALGKMIQSMLDCVKIGESTDTAISKLAKLTQTLTYFDMKKLQYTGYFFTPMTEKEILDNVGKHFKTCLFLYGKDYRTFTVVFYRDVPKVRRFYFA